MTPPEAARAYLEAVLKERGIPLKAASQALGRSHSYLQQYLRRGKPLWLSESDRAALAVIVGKELDEGRLKPPPPELRPLSLPTHRVAPEGERKTQIHPPRRGQFVDDPSALELLDAWQSIRSDDLRRLALSIVKQMGRLT